MSKGHRDPTWCSGKTTTAPRPRSTACHVATAPSPRRPGPRAPIHSGFGTCMLHNVIHPDIATRPPIFSQIFSCSYLILLFSLLCPYLWTNKQLSMLLMYIYLSLAPVTLETFCQGTKLEWCSIIEITISSSSFSLSIPYE